MIDELYAEYKVGPELKLSDMDLTLGISMEGIPKTLSKILDSLILYRAEKDDD